MIAATLLALAAAGQADALDSDLSDVLGRAMPEWQVERWVDGGRRTLASLRGKVVLVRWFTSPSCPYCTASAETLKALDVSYRAAGLTVIGMYHHKDRGPPAPSDPDEAVKAFGFTFPVAVDAGWATLNAWWLDGHPMREYTSVSFLLDRTGKTRHVHFGGTLAEGPALDAMKAQIVALLAEPAPS